MALRLVAIGAASDAAGAYRLPWAVARAMLRASDPEEVVDSRDLYQMPSGRFAPKRFSRMYAMLGALVRKVT